LGLIEDLGPGPVALDSVAFIYFIEEHPLYLPAIEPVFSAIHQGKTQAVTSSLTLLETLVIPLRGGNLGLAQRYEALLSRSRGLQLVQIDLGLLRSAAQLRATTRLKTPDAIQLATALVSGCSALVTNDRDYPSLPGLRTLQLRNYLTPNA
jgi:predicted nucleic acid-binding protein